MFGVLLADKHVVVRDNILRMLARDPRIKVLGEASDIPEAVTKIREFRPDVLILDVDMPLAPHSFIPDLNGELSSCGAKLLGISFANDDEARSLATRLGAEELLDKVNLGKELIPAIVRIASSAKYLPPARAKQTDAGELQ